MPFATLHARTLTHVHTHTPTPLTHRTHPPTQKKQPFVRETLLSWGEQMVRNHSLDGLRLDAAINVPHVSCVCDLVCLPPCGECVSRR